jgi:hypothetical protein
LLEIFNGLRFAYGLIGCSASSPVALEGGNLKQFIFYLVLPFQYAGGAVQISKLIDDEHIEEI